jgi:hypothetical protein
VGKREPGSLGSKAQKLPRKVEHLDRYEVVWEDAGRGSYDGRIDGLQAHTTVFNETMGYIVRCNRDEIVMFCDRTCASDQQTVRWDYCIPTRLVYEKRNLDTGAVEILRPLPPHAEVSKFPPPHIAAALAALAASKLKEEEHDHGSRAPGSKKGEEVQ